MESIKEDKKEIESDKNETKENQETELTTFTIFIKTNTEKKSTIQLQVSPIDNVQDIKQYLFESIETCYITTYNLYFEGKKLNDYSEISEIPQIQQKSILTMVDALYDERSIRLHVRRLREILISSESSISHSVFSHISKETNFAIPQLNGQDSGAMEEESNKNQNGGEDKLKQNIIEEEINDSDIPVDLGSPLSGFFPPSQNSTTNSCVKSICFSGWNPPPGNRKLSGDLIYLEVVTLENRTLNITGWSKGFFVNSTSGQSFNPNPSEKAFHSHSLAGLLNQASAQFKKNFQNLLINAFQKHPFEMFPVPFPVNSWILSKNSHCYDLNRAEDALMFTSETDLRGQLRDWNEEFQSCRELPRETIQERIARDRGIVKINSDFVEAAIKGASAIIEKTVPPINPLDPEKAQMYIYNNIFFSYALDGRDFFKDFGGDKAAYVSVNNDLKGIKAFNRADIKGLYTLATAIVDYRGHRIVAQSIIPGILQREQTSNVVYGSIDNGKTICSEPNFHQLMLEAGKFLHIREHTVLDGEGKEFKLCCPVESKGIIGTDTRKYILDLVRITPRDANYTGKNNILTILRPELIAAYYEHLKIKEEEKEKIEEGTQEQNEADVKSQKPENKQPSNGKEEISELKEEKKEIEFPALNPNSLCELPLSGTPEEIKEDESRVKELSSFLLETMIPILVEDFSWMLSIPVDGLTLTQALHAHGINVRYLGLVVSHCEKISNPIIKDLCLREMITRSTKHILRDILRETEDYNLAGGISHFFNCFFGSAKSREEKPPSQKPKKNLKKEGSGFKVFSTSSTSLWPQIVEDVKERFKFDLPDRETLKGIIKSPQTLRSLCQKVGIQVEAKDYQFDAEIPFQSQNILGLFPIVKHCDPESNDGKNLLEVGKSFLGQGRLDIAYELLTEALAIFHQVYGPMHRDTAHCYSNLGTVLFHAKDFAQALDHQQKATVINERVLGLDHHDTSQSYVCFIFLLI